MNSWELNSKSSYLVRKAISTFFNIPFTDVYKIVKTIEFPDKIITKDGKKFQLTLTQIV